MKFAMSYSCGKDSTLALHKLIEAGHQPVCLLTVFNQAAGRSYFHGASPALLQQYAEALQLPLLSLPAAAGAAYAAAFEEGLQKAKALGAEAACFGDIDIAENRSWEEARCAAAGLTACFPLWQCGREENVRELLWLGYKCLIKSVNSKILPKSLAGQYLNAKTMAIIKAAGADVCGEAGEYHTLVVDGPLFKQSLQLQCGEVLQFGDYAVVDIK